MYLVLDLPPNFGPKYLYKNVLFFKMYFGMRIWISPSGFEYQILPVAFSTPNTPKYILKNNTFLYKYFGPNLGGKSNTKYM